MFRSKIKILFSFIVILNTLLSNSLFAQGQTYNFLKVGVNGIGVITDTYHLNNMVTDWSERVAEANNLELVGDTPELPINIEYGFQPFIIVQPLKNLQVGIKMDYTYSSLKGEFNNSLINKNYELTYKIKTYSPGLFANFSNGNLQLGAGLISSFTNINVNDDFFGYHDTWSGNNIGFELGLGYASTQEGLFGYTMGLRYRNLYMNEFKDNLNRNITFASNQNSLSLNLSGLVLELGIYFQFIKKENKKNED